MTKKIYLGLLLQLLICFTPVCCRAETQTLEQAWSLAYQQNPSLEAERAKLRATDELVAQANSHWRPSVDATGTVGKTYQYTPDEAPFGLQNFAGNTRGYGVQVTQPLFRGFRTVQEHDEANNEVLTERAKLTTAEQQLFIDTAKAYLDVLRDMTVLGFQRDNEHVLEKKLDEAKDRARVGELTQTDMRQAESRLARARVARYQAESSLTESQASYRRLVGVLPDGLVAPALTRDEAKELDEVLHLAETQNPTVLSAQYASEAAKSDISLNKGSLLPEINLVGSSRRDYGQNSTLPGRVDTSQVLVQATLPLYKGGADYSKIREAQQTATERTMELNEARHKAHETAENAWQVLKTSDSAVVADRDEVEAASKALEGVREESRMGSRTTLDVLNAEQELLDARTDLAKMQHDRDLAILQIKSAIGELTADRLNLSVGTYDPKHHYDDVRGQWIGFSRDDDDYKVKPLVTSSNANDGVGK